MFKMKLLVILFIIKIFAQRNILTFSIQTCFLLSLLSVDINNFRKGTKWLFSKR